MDEKETENTKPRFTVVPRRKPLPSELAAAAKQQVAPGSPKAPSTNQPQPALSPNGSATDPAKDALARAGFRAESEDDDGYDPYSDFHDAPERRPLFEKDPWD